MRDCLLFIINFLSFILNENKKRIGIGPKLHMLLNSNTTKLKKNLEKRTYLYINLLHLLFILLKH